MFKPFEASSFPYLGPNSGLGDKSGESGSMVGLLTASSLVNCFFLLILLGLGLRK